MERTLPRLILFDNNQTGEYLSLPPTGEADENRNPTYDLHRDGRNLRACRQPMRALFIRADYRPESRHVSVNLLAGATVRYHPDLHEPANIDALETLETAVNRMTAARPVAGELELRRPDVARGRNG